MTFKPYVLAVCWVFATQLFASSNPAHAAAALDPALQARVRDAIFEVVMKKPEVDSLTYEKPLPLDRLPFIERTDKYRSVGTAFAIGANTYVSAAHVFDSAMATQYGEPALRDGSGGAVHVVDKIVKYSNEQDFIVFTLKVPFAGKPLDVNRKPALNEPVVTAGNALGEGVVMRDGLLTSETPEEVDGRWKWLRFSAAASPGNSGGPLLDTQGRVVGVVLRKSQNENLNYASPISLILDAPANLARIGGYVAYQLPVLETKEGEKQQHAIPLPKSYADFSAAQRTYWNGLYDTLQTRLLTKNAATIFPRGDGARQLLNSPEGNASLALIVRKADGSWESNGGTGGANATLGHNGYVSLGALAGAMGARIRKPDDVPTARFYADSKAYMDYLLKAFPLQRQVGEERIRVTSLGPAKQQSMFTDAYGRKWQVRSWNVEFWDIVTVSYALAVPEGYVAMVRVVPTSGVHDAELDLRGMTAFADISLHGTLEQWRGYLAQNALLPTNFANIDIAFDYGKNFHYKSKRMNLSFDNSLQKVNKDSYLTLRFAYFEDRSKALAKNDVAKNDVATNDLAKNGAPVVWDVAGVHLLEKKDGGQNIDVSRHARPHESLPDGYQSAWTKMLNRAYPYDASVIESDGDVSVNAIYPPAPLPPAEAAKTNVLYGLNYGNEGKHSADEVKATLAKWFQGLQVQEK